MNCVSIKYEFISTICLFKDLHQLQAHFFFLLGSRTALRTWPLYNRVNIGEQTWRPGYKIDTVEIYIYIDITR